MILNKIKEKHFFCYKKCLYALKINVFYHFNINIVKKYFKLKPLVQENLLISNKSNNLKIIGNDKYLQKY